MKKVNIKGWQIEIDTKKTLEFYNNVDKDDILSCCIYCKNYYYGIRKTSKILIDFFNDLGIVPEKVAHLSELMKLDNGKHLYDVDYLLCGNILTQPIEVENVRENGALGTKMIELTDSISFNFTDKRPSSVSPHICPQPLLTLQLICEVPWVLDEFPD